MANVLARLAKGAISRRKALENQRDDLLAFAGILDAKLAGIAQGSKVALELVRDACLLQRKSSLSTAYWKRWN